MVEDRGVGEGLLGGTKGGGKHRGHVTRDDEEDGK